MSKPTFKLAIGAGAVQASHGTYISRPADEQLWDACREGRFAYVLASRQIGKTSLKNEIATRLEGRGFKTAHIDLSGIGQTEVEAETWYFTLLRQLVAPWGLEAKLEAWWERQPKFSSLTDRFLHFFADVVLIEITESVVVFIDEIDVTLNLSSFTDDFFAAIRAAYHQRAQNPAYKRLTFVLLGVATPSELIQEQTRTPFNIGEAVKISDFTEVEAANFHLAIEEKHPGQGMDYLRQIYAWTDGHPYLTQRLCLEINKVQPPRNVKELVDEVS
ncbi:AAA-like domain-containing protein [Chloroflexi bacterium TSY]|nr:AAA-like domain-containing protein [Chloroflexi bacterium TSY]